VRLAAKPTGYKRFEPDYFSLSDFSRTSVITVHQRVAVLRGETVSVEQYVTHVLVGELLMMTAKRNLAHTASKKCVFDECQDRSTISDCIERAWVCQECMAELKRANVDDDTIREATKLLVWCKRNQLSYVGKFTTAHPLTNLVVGTAVGGYFSDFIHNANAVVIAIALLAPVVSVAIYARWFKK